MSLGSQNARVESTAEKFGFKASFEALAPLQFGTGDLRSGLPAKSDQAGKNGTSYLCK
jgi:hypothetical protein